MDGGTIYVVVTVKTLQPNFFLIFGRMAYFFGGFSASRIFSDGSSASDFFPANPAEIRRLRAATTTKGYFYYKDPL